MSKQNDDSLEPVGDELSAYDDLVRALQAPGSASELAGEEQFRTAFREAHGPIAPVVSLPSRMARRIGVGGTAVIVVVAVSSGVAAAVTGNLPDPVQEFAHSVLGAPAPESPAQKQAAPQEIKPLPDPASTPTTPEASPSNPTESTDAQTSPDKPGKPSRSSEPVPTSSATAEPSPGPKDEPTQGAEPPAVPKPVPASLTMSGGSHLSSYGGTLSLFGRVTASDGAPIAGRKVVLQVRAAEGWRRVLRTKSDSNGSVAASSAPVTGLDRYRWKVHAPLRSSVWRVRVKPTVSASYAVNGDQTTVTAATVGARPGDLVGLYARVKKQPTLVGEARVRADGTAEFTLTTPKRHPRTVVVRLQKSRDHAAARTRLKVTPPA